MWQPCDAQTGNFFLDWLSRCLPGRPRGKAQPGKCQGLVRRETGLEISAPAPFITVTVSLPVTRFSGPYHPFWVISGRRGPRSPKSSGALSLPPIHFKVSIKLRKTLFFTQPLPTKWHHCSNHEHGKIVFRNWLVLHTQVKFCAHLAYSNISGLPSSCICIYCLYFVFLNFVWHGRQSRVTVC